MMKKSLDHLPSLKRAELLRVVEVLKASFAEATATRRADRLKNGRILKIILYGSYARGDWVDDPLPFEYACCSSQLPRVCTRIPRVG